MSGGVYRVRGATGAAPTTSFFGPIPDRFTIACPMKDAGSYYEAHSAATLISDFVPFNTNWYGGADVATCSFGSSTTAPDGSTDAVKLIEGTTNSFHFVMAGSISDLSRSPPCSMRFAVFVKAAERTRIGLAIGADNYANAANNIGCRAIFDLANGTVAVTGTTTTHAARADWSRISEDIISFGNDWYLCQMDVRLQGLTGIKTGYGNAIFGQVYLDNGSGAAAASISYTGDGTSGIYVWRACLMPSAAWGMADQQIFFDDFDDDTMANFDLTDSRAAGFTWYVHNAWAEFPGIPPTLAASLSVADSVVTITDPAAFGFTFASAAWLGSWDAGSPGFYGDYTNYVGKAFKMRDHSLWEARYSYETNKPYGARSASTTVVWTQPLGSNAKGGLFGEYPGGYPHVGLEWDQAEVGTLGIENDPLTSVHQSFGDQVNHALRLAPIAGIKVWLSAYTFDQDDRVIYNGVLYKALVQTTPGDAPDTFPLQWQANPTQGPFEPPLAGINVVDLSEMHTYSHLWIPSTNIESGHILDFFDGNCPYRGHITIGPVCDDPDCRGPVIWQDDNFLLIVAGGAPTSSSGGYDAYYDWISLSN